MTIALQRDGELIKVNGLAGELLGTFPVEVLREVLGAKEVHAKMPMLGEEDDDASDEDLRGIANKLYEAMGVMLEGEECDHSVGYCLCKTFDMMTKVKGILDRQGIPSASSLKATPTKKPRATKVAALLRSAKAKRLSEREAKMLSGAIFDRFDDEMKEDLKRKVKAPKKSALKKSDRSAVLAALKRIKSK